MAKPTRSRTTKSEVMLLRARLAEAEVTLNAIRNGDVDAIAVEGPHGQQIFTPQSADHRSASWPSAGARAPPL